MPHTPNAGSRMPSGGGCMVRSRRFPSHEEAPAPAATGRGREALNPEKGASVQNLPEQTELELAGAHPADPLGVYDHHAYLPWEFIHFNLPYRRPAEPIWTRTNSNATFEVVAGRIQMPDGTVDRFVPYGKQALRRAALDVHGGEAHQLTNARAGALVQHVPQQARDRCSHGLARWAGEHHDKSNPRAAAPACSRLRLRCRPTMRDPDGRVHLRDFGYRLTSASSLWFSHREAADVEGLFPSTVTLSSELFGSIIERGNPVNLEGWRTIQATSKSPLALDVYVWLCSRLWGLRGVARPSWDQLLQQFGAQASRKEFVRACSRPRSTAVGHYPEARVAERFDAAGPRAWSWHPRLPRWPLATAGRGPGASSFVWLIAQTVRWAYGCSRNG